MKKLIALAMAFCVILTGCTFPGLGSNGGSLAFESQNVMNIQIQNQTNGSVTAIQDRNTISELVKLINALSLREEASDPPEAVYSLTLNFSDGADSYVLTLHSEDIITAAGAVCSTDAKDLLVKAEKLECATLTDKQLLERIFEDHYWDTVTIKNEKGELSVDKILSLPSQCPALFELIGRPSAIKSLADHGIELLETYAQSSSESLRQRAKKLGDILSTLIPSVKDKIGDVFSDFTG